LELCFTRSATGDNRSCAEEPDEAKVSRPVLERQGGR